MPRSDDLSLVAQLLGVKDFQSVAELRYYYPGISAAFPKLGDKGFVQLIAQLKEGVAKGRTVDQLFPKPIDRRKICPKEDRNRAIVEMLGDDPYLTFTEVGEKFGISRERVRVIYKQWKKRKC
jgi:Sigma-70, region 4